MLNMAGIGSKSFAAAPVSVEKERHELELAHEVEPLLRIAKQELEQRGNGKAPTPIIAATLQP